MPALQASGIILKLLYSSYTEEEVYEEQFLPRFACWMEALCVPQTTIPRLNPPARGGLNALLPDGRPCCLLKAISTARHTSERGQEPGVGGRVKCRLTDGWL